MKNSQLKPAYNVLIGVKGEYIVGIDISSERSDFKSIINIYECESCLGCELIAIFT